jgi:hypothetical protein
MSFLEAFSKKGLTIGVIKYNPIKVYIYHRMPLPCAENGIDNIEVIVSLKQTLSV